MIQALLQYTQGVPGTAGTHPHATGKTASTAAEPAPTGTSRHQLAPTHIEPTFLPWPSESAQ